MDVDDTNPAFTLDGDEPMKNWIWRAAVGLALLTFGTTVVRSLIAQAGAAPAPQPSAGAPATEERPPSELRGTEVVVVFLSASFCMGAQNPDLRRLLPTLRARLTENLTGTEDEVTMIGVALDARPAEGIDYLQGMAEFDEIIAGKNLLNSGAIRFFWRDLPGSPEIPQIVVLRRTYHLHGSSGDIGPDEEVVRFTGSDEISRWIEGGAPLPQSVASGPSH
jgi:hypothetical protein